MASIHSIVVDNYGPPPFPITQATGYRITGTTRLALFEAWGSTPTPIIDSSFQ